MHVFRRKTSPSCAADPPPDVVDPQTAPPSPEATAEQDQAQAAPITESTEPTVAGGSCRCGAGDSSTAIAAAIDHTLRDVVRELGDRLTEMMCTRLETCENQMHDLVSTTAVRAVHRPIIDQYLALLDRMKADRKFWAKHRKENAEAAGHPDCGRLREEYDAAIASYIDELEAMLRPLDVIPISVPPGSFNYRHQQVVAVEPTDDPELDGHVSEVIRPGYLWAGTVLRPEQVRIFKKGT